MTDGETKTKKLTQQDYLKLKDRCDTLESALGYADGLLYHMFIQACTVERHPMEDVGLNAPKYDHCCMGTYEEVQEYLLERGFIKEEECVRP